jgi:hypothetical protein
MEKIKLSYTISKGEPRQMNVRTYALSLWELLDPIYYYLTRLKYLEEKRKCILRVRMTIYKGREVLLSDGTKIQKNDKLLKIHLHNVKLLKEMKEIKNDTRRALYVYNRVKESLPFLAMYISNHKDADELKGIVGITMLRKSSRRLGFETFVIKNKWYRNLKRTTAIPIHLLSVNTTFRETLKHSTPEYLFMSKEQLIKKYRVN